MQVFLLVSASQAFLLNLCIFWCTTTNSPLATTVTGMPSLGLHCTARHQHSASFTLPCRQAQIVLHARLTARQQQPLLNNVPGIC